MRKILLCLLSAIAIAGMIVGCSSRNVNPTIPSTPNIPTISEGTDSTSTHTLCGIWDVAIDTETMKITTTPSRELATHFNATGALPAPEMEAMGWNPATKIINLKTTIKNPFLISGYDVRLIVYTDNIGHKLLNSDDWTSVYDISGGLPINPFKAFCKHIPNRKFFGSTQSVETIDVYLPLSEVRFRIAIDVSFPSNCWEPYDISDFKQKTVYDIAGSSCDAEIKVHSWNNDVKSVYLYCPQITNRFLVPFSQIDSERWGLVLTNVTGAAHGHYTGYIVAYSNGGNGIALYDEIDILITSINSGWARTWGGVGDDGGTDVAVDNDGNIYSTGGFLSTVDFDPEPETQDIHTSNGFEDIFLVKYDKYGNFHWVKTWGGSNGDIGYAIDIDSLGSVFVTGIFQSTVDFGTSGTPDVHISKGGTDCYLTKYDPNGNYQGTVTWGGGGLDRPWRMCIGVNDCICITGDFEGTADFDPNPSQTDNHASKGSYDAYVMKLSNVGGLLWARTWGSTSDDYGKGVACDNTSAVYCSGYFWGTCDFDPGSGTDNHTANGYYDASLSKFDTNGNFQWAHTWGSTDEDEAWECAVDENNDVYVTGSFYYTVDFNPNPAETENRTAVWESDVFVSKFAPDGDFKWVLTWGGSSYDYGRVISTNGNGNFWVGGSTMIGTNVDYDPGTGTDIKNGGDYISNFNINGQYNWSRIWRGDNVSMICLDAGQDSKTYIGGLYHGGFTDFDPSENTWYPTNYISGNDCFIIKILPNGYWE